ncbi:MAG: helix-turn-helix transcriptional regulator [Chloroflexi bacterium]|nr:helix-turn-helix transcriptional regulator [Chloroflexota bacterium]
MATLKELRKKRVLSQRDLADISGVSHATINRLENGLQEPRFKTIRKLAKALKVKPNEIEF